MEQDNTCLRAFSLAMQVNAAFESNVDDCNVEGFMHALGYASFRPQGERFLSQHDLRVSGPEYHSQSLLPFTSYYRILLMRLQTQQYNPRCHEKVPTFGRFDTLTRAKPQNSCSVCKQGNVCIGGQSKIASSACPNGHELCAVQARRPLALRCTLQRRPARRAGPHGTASWPRPRTASSQSGRTRREHRPGLRAYHHKQCLVCERQSGPGEMLYHPS